MKRLLASLALVTAAATLSGCYYDPGYGYVRNGGAVYYGQSAPVYDNGYYVAPGYYDNYYYGDGYYGCCYAPGVSIGIGGAWYGGSRYRYGNGVYRNGYRGNNYRAQGRSTGHATVHQSHGNGHDDHH